MRKGRELIGMPVVVADGHMEIERVEGLVLDLTETHVSALLVDSDDRSRQARVLDLHDVQSFGETEIEVGSPNVIHSVDQVPDIRRFLNVESPVFGAHLVTDEGVDVGTVDDLLFDEQTGGIEVFEVSNDTFSDRFLDHEPLPLFDELDDEIIVHTSKVRQMEEAQPLARIKVCTPAISRAISGRSTGNVNRETDSDEAIANELKKDSSANLPMPAGLMRRPSGELWRGLTSKTYGFMQKVFEAVENRRIEQSIGHRIRRTVLGKDGFVLFEKADIVTPAVVQRARQANVLGDLLNAVDQSSIEQIETEKDKQMRGWMDEWWPPYI